MSAAQNAECERLSDDEKEAARLWLYDYNGGVPGGLAGLWEMVEQIIAGRLAGVEAVLSACERRTERSPDRVLTFWVNEVRVALSGGDGHSDPDYVDCTCGHPNDDHSPLGECPFPGCGCGALDDEGGPWTRHGHVVLGMTVDGPGRPAIARCGGPKTCRECAADAAFLRSPERVGRPAQPGADS